MLGKWRIVEKYSADSNRFIFEYNQGTHENPDWHIAVPFDVCPDTPTLDEYVDYSYRDFFITEPHNINFMERHHVSTNSDGTVVIAGGPYIDNGSNNRGEAHIFTFNPASNSWSSIRIKTQLYSFWTIWSKC